MKDTYFEGVMAENTSSLVDDISLENENDSKMDDEDEENERKLNFSFEKNINGYYETNHFDEEEKGKDKNEGKSKDIF